MNNRNPKRERGIGLAHASGYVFVAKRRLVVATVAFAVDVPHFPRSGERSYTKVALRASIPSQLGFRVQDVAEVVMTFEIRGGGRNS